ncbi:MAG: tetratricopeptide repeat protein [Candidatus Cloacimonetes bacterium]|nr:tetratricopeptide repeat protein [Candidatus Cloacimonadota bacterium]
MKRIFLIFLLFFTNIFLFSINTNIDSLEAELDKHTGSEKIGILNNLSVALREISPQKSLEYGKLAFELAEKSNDEKQLATTLNNIGGSHFFLGNYDKALDYHLQVLKIDLEMDNKPGLANTYNNIGLIYQMLCKYDKALSHFLLSLQIERELCNDNGIAKSLNNLGNFYYDMGNYNKALEYYHQSLDIKENIGNKKDIANVLNNIGVIQAERGNYNSSLEYYRKSLEIEKELGNINGIASSLNNIGLIHANLEDYKKALDYFQRSLNLTMETGDKCGIANTFINIGNLNLKQKKYDKAYANLNQGLQLAKEIKASGIILDGYLLLSEYYSNIKNYKKALTNYRLYIKEKDRIFNEDNNRQIVELQTKYDLSEREKEIALLQKNNEIYKLGSEKRNLFIILLIISTILTFALAAFIYYRLKLKANSNLILKREVLDRLTTEKKLKQMLKIEHVISSISSRFIKVEDIDLAINDSLCDIGKICEASRSYLFLLKENGELMDNSHEWCDAGVSSMIADLKDLSTKYFSWWMDKFKSGEAINESNINVLPEEAKTGRKILLSKDAKAILILPLNINDELTGFIGFENIKETKNWGKEDISILRLSAEIMTIYLERKAMEDALHKAYDMLELRVKERTLDLEKINKELQLEIAERKRAEKQLNVSYNRLKKAMEETVNALISAVEVRDPYTAGHQLRVANLSLAIAKEMNLSKKQLDSIRIAAILHDIGKIYIPYEVLCKPDKLTKSEYIMIKNHPLAAYDILKTIEFQLPVAKIVYQHHEKMDGSGYPQGLTGNEIMMEARIVNVADVVDAMLSSRPYRPALDIKEALKELSVNEGKLYDPDVVKACTFLFNEKAFQFEEIKVRKSPR